MTLPKLPKFPKLFAAKTRKKLHVAAASRRAAPPVEESYDEPQTNFSSAIIVVLILHLVAVGGIYAFQGIKAHRKTQEGAAVAVEPAVASASAKQAAAVVPQPAAPTVSKPLAVKTPTKVEAPEHPPVSPAASVITGARVHHVKSGENLTRIAAMYNVSVGEIEELNGGPKAVATVRAGQVLNLPKTKAAATPVKSVPAPVKKTEEPVKAAASSKSVPKTYVVVKGDIPEIIAKKLGVNYQELLKLNNIEDPTKIPVGRTLKVPQKKN